MNIRDLFIRPPASRPPSYAGSQISQSAGKFLAHLKTVKNTAYAKGGEAKNTFLKSEKYATKLMKSAEIGDSAATYKNVKKLHNYSSKLFPMIENCFNRQTIWSASFERREIARILLENNLSVR